MAQPELSSPLIKFNRFLTLRQCTIISPCSHTFFCWLQVHNQVFKCFQNISRFYFFSLKSLLYSMLQSLVQQSIFCSWYVFYPIWHPCIENNEFHYQLDSNSSKSPPSKHIEHCVWWLCRKSHPMLLLHSCKYNYRKKLSWQLSQYYLLCLHERHSPPIYLREIMY